MLKDSLDNRIGKFTFLVNWRLWNSECNQKSGKKFLIQTVGKQMCGTNIESLLLEGKTCSCCKSGILLNHLYTQLWLTVGEFREGFHCKEGRFHGNSIDAMVYMYACIIVNPRPSLLHNKKGVEKEEDNLGNWLTILVANGTFTRLC